MGRKILGNCETDQDAIFTATVETKRGAVDHRMPVNTFRGNVMEPAR